MRKLNRILAAAVLALGATGLATAEEWPQWRGPHGDGISRETNLLTQWPADGPKQLWTTKVGLGHASPVAVAGKVYMFTYDASKNQETLHAIDGDSGKVLWSESYPGGYKGMDKDWLGTRATPVVVGDKIYTYGGSGDLVARNVADGKEVWHLNVLKETAAQPITWGQSSSPLVVGDMIYVQGGKGSGAPVAVAVNRNDGKVAWKSEAVATMGKAKEDVAGAYAQPILATVGQTKQLVVFAGAALYGMDPATGKTLWSEPWLTEYDVNASTPVYLEPNLFVTSGYNHGCMMLELSATGAKKLWEAKDVQSKFNGDILDRGTLYCMSGEPGFVKALSWPDGKVKWEVKDAASRLGAGGSFVRFGDSLILLSQKGSLALASATPEGYKKISEVSGVGSGKNVWATPVIYHGKLYVKTVEDLVCFDIAAK